MLERLGFTESVANPGLRWVRVTAEFVSCWVERNPRTMVWTVTYWRQNQGKSEQPLTLGSTDLTTTLIFAEVEGVTGG